MLTMGHSMYGGVAETQVFFFSFSLGGFLIFLFPARFKPSSAASFSFLYIILYSLSYCLLK
jgi:hypothetical protein